MADGRLQDILFGAVLDGTVDLDGGDLHIADQPRSAGIQQGVVPCEVCLGHGVGVFFGEQSVGSVTSGIRKFEKLKFDGEQVAKLAERFDETKFDKNFRKAVDEALKK